MGWGNSSVSKGTEVRAFKTIRVFITNPRWIIDVCRYRWAVCHVQTKTEQSRMLRQNAGYDWIRPPPFFLNTTLVTVLFLQAILGF